MQSDKPPPLPPGWGFVLRGTVLGRYYERTDPEESGVPDVYITKSDENWEIEYWVDTTSNWITVFVPLTPEPPFELAEALYCAAQ